MTSTIPVSFQEAPSPAEPVALLFHCMLAGGFGGMVGDTAMHSLDTVKTRQQGFPGDKYRQMVPAYRTILREEGLFRGLYGGYSPAILGLFPSTAAFFGTYEYAKRTMIGAGVNETALYFVAGILGDLALSVFYVPLEVLKTRLQLQGRYNNPYTAGSGYNYRGLWLAVRTIARTEGSRTFVFGYKETLFRDLPFLAIQFAFYEKFRQWAIWWHGRDLPVWLELGTGAAAGGLAGVLTTPLDVIKTRTQTASDAVAGDNASDRLGKTRAKIGAKVISEGKSEGTLKLRPTTIGTLVSIYRNEGIFGAFSGVGPRFIWTGVQSSIMLLLYQVALRELENFGEGKLT